MTGSLFTFSSKPKQLSPVERPGIGGRGALYRGLVRRSFRHQTLAIFDGIQRRGGPRSAPAFKSFDAPLR
ncbi:MAG: hypothetical protein JSR66_08410 [Proteobacteria bacterium]|nr:hypothetical protein [Pseudomonadota bacterium]